MMKSSLELQKIFEGMKPELREELGKHDPAKIERFISELAHVYFYWDLYLDAERPKAEHGYSLQEISKQHKEAMLEAVKKYIQHLEREVREIQDKLLPPGCLPNENVIKGLQLSLEHGPFYRREKELEKELLLLKKQRGRPTGDIKRQIVYEVSLLYQEYLGKLSRGEKGPFFKVLRIIIKPLQLKPPGLSFRLVKDTLDNPPDSVSLSLLLKILRKNH